ncbi:MAG: oxidoreductase [Janthinobacterium lividum]
MRPPIRVGLLGYGYAGRTFHAPLIAAEPGLALVAVGSRDPAKVHADLADVVVADPLVVATSPQVDLVVVATPNDTHAPLATAALRAGKHVVVDKPFTLDLAEARALVALAERQDRLLSVFHNRRWDSDYLSIARAIADGVVGDVAHFESHVDRFRPEVRARWREGAGAGSGVWFDLGPHLVDQTLRLFGLPERVTATLARQRPGALADDWAHVVFDCRSENGGARRVILHAAMLVAGGSPRFVVHGTRASLVKHSPDRQEAQLLAGMPPGGAGWGTDPDPIVVHAPDGTRSTIPAIPGDQRRYYRAIAAALAGAGVNPVPPGQALAVMAVVEAAVRSARAGAAVAIDLTDAERRAAT